MVPSDTDFDTKVTLETEMSPLPEDPPFHILFIGDWSGRESRAVKSDLAKSKPMEIDRDNLDEVLRKLNVGLELEFQSGDGNALSLEFRELEDFHPDRIFRNLPLFADLRDVRRRLINSRTFNEAAREVRSWFVEKEDGEFKAEIQDVIPEELETSSGNLLNQILGQADDRNNPFDAQSGESSELSAFVKKLVRPHLIQTDVAEQSELLVIVDEIISDLMRKVLHHPHFQALESAWRGIHLLIRRVETDKDLKVYLLDISKNEITSNLKSVNDLNDSVLYKIFSRKNGGTSAEESWAVVCGDYTFSLNVDDAATLIRISKIAANTDTPFISHIKPEIFGFESFEDTDSSDNWKTSENSTAEKLWATLRSNPESVYLALAMPQTLARLPYGEKTDPTEDFYFEEFTDIIQHRQYLWTNPAYAVSLLLAQTFRQFGWNMSQNFLQDVDNLPSHFYQKEYEDKTKPCAEILMTQSNCEKILDQGIIPLIAFKDSNKVRVGSFQSISYPPSLLMGKWR